MSRLRGFLCAATVSSALVNAATTTASLSINSVLGYFFNDDGELRGLGCSKSQTPVTRTLFTSLTYADCCDYSSTMCPIPMTCVDNTLFMDDGSMNNCIGPYYCVTATIYETSPSGFPTATLFYCGWDYLSISVLYRQTPSTSSAAAISTEDHFSPPPTSYSSTIPSATSFPTSTSTETRSSDPETVSSSSSSFFFSFSPSSPSSSSASSSSSFSSSSSSPSKTWIAGAVIGPVAGIAFGFLGFMLGRRGRKKSSPAPSVSNSFGYQAPEVAEVETPQQWMQPEMEQQQQQPAELEGNSSVDVSARFHPK